MKLLGRAARIVDDAVLLQSGDAGCVKPYAHHERPEDEHDHWRENWTRQCQPPRSQVHREIISSFIEWPQRIARHCRPDEARFRFWPPSSACRGERYGSAVANNRPTSPE